MAIIDEAVRASAGRLLSPINNMHALAEVVDPTGAGDSFAGGLVGYLAKTGDYTFDNMKNVF